MIYCTQQFLQMGRWSLELESLGCLKYKTRKKEDDSTARSRRRLGVCSLFYRLGRDQHDSFVFWSSRAHTVRWKGQCDGHQSAYQTDLKKNWKSCVQFKLYIDAYRGLQTGVVYKRSNYRSAYKSFSLCWECEPSYNPDTLYNVKRNSLC